MSRLSSMKTRYKVILALLTVITLWGGPVILNYFGYLDLAYAIAIMLISIGGTFLFIVLYGAYKVATSDSSVKDTVTGSSGGTYRSIIEQINDELKSLEGREEIDFLFGESIDTEQKIIDGNTFFGIVARKKKNPNKVVIVYSPDKVSKNGTKIWRYRDDPSADFRRNPFYNFRPFGRRNRRRSEEEIRDDNSNVNINLGNKDEFRPL